MGSYVYRKMFVYRRYDPIRGHTIHKSTIGGNQLFIVVITLQKSDISPLPRS